MTLKKDFNTCERCKTKFNYGFILNVLKSKKEEYWADYYDYIFDVWYEFLCLKCFYDVEFIVIVRYDKKEVKSIKKFLEGCYKIAENK